MLRMKRFLTITLLMLVVGLGTPAAFADGNAESPGIKTTETITLDGNAEAPGVTGNAEAPGFMTTVLIYLDVII
jgi:hypothetical protein